MRKTYFNLIPTLHFVVADEKGFPIFPPKTIWLSVMMLAVFYKKIGLEEYNPQEWQLFIDTSVESLKCALLHNGNKYASIPIGHSIIMKEE